MIYNLENSGIAAKIIPFLASLAFGGTTGSSYKLLIHKLINDGHYFFSSHLFVLACELITSFLAVKHAKALGIRHYWLAGVICLLTTRFTGKFVINIKGIPFALFYTSYSLASSVRIKQSLGQAQATTPPYFYHLQSRVG